MAIVERVCVCGKAFTVLKPSDPKRFCTFECSVKHQPTPVKEQTCERCGITFMFKGRTRCKYCRPCYKKVRCEAVTRSRVKAGRLMKPGVGRGGNQEGDNNPMRKHGACLTNYRKTCFQRWEKKCVVCGSERYIEVNHVDGNPSNSVPENLVPMCRACHRSIRKLASRTQQLPADVLFSVWTDGRSKIAEKIWNPETGIRGEGGGNAPPAATTRN